MRRKAFLALMLVLLLVTAIPAFAEDSGPQGSRGGASTTGAPPEGGSSGVGASAAGPSSLTAVGPSATKVFMWSNLYRDATYVYSDGWTSANNYLYMARSKNHLCKRNSCTAWYAYKMYNVRYVWAGWSWASTTWCVWRTNTEHRFKVTSADAIVTRKTVLKVNF
jgi:hypothetical protein